jgi:putative tricarboxylic transport membrane protein
VGIFLCAAAGALVLGAARDTAAPAGAAEPRAGLTPDARARVIVTTAGLIGFCLLLPWIGYPVCAFLFVALLLRRLGGARWPSVVVSAAVSAFLSHYVFAVLLGVPLPSGPF